MSKLQMLVLSLVVVVYLASRLFQMPHMPIFTDEAAYCWAASCMHADLPSTWFHDYGDKGPYFLWMIALGQWVIQDPILGGRLVVVVSSLLGVFGAFALGRIAGNIPIGLGMSALFVISPLVLVHDGLTLFDPLLTAWVLWGMALIFWIFQQGHRSWKPALALGIVTALAMELKITAAELIAFSFVACWLFVKPEDRKSYWRPLLSVFAVAILVRVGLVFFQMALGISRPAAGMSNLSSFLTQWDTPLIALWPQKEYMLRNILGVFVFYWGLLPALLTLWGGWITWKADKRIALFFTGWVTLPLFFYVVFTTVAYPRYLLPHLMPLFYFASRGLWDVGCRVRNYLTAKQISFNGSSKSWVRAIGWATLFSLCFFPMLNFSRQHVINPIKSDYPMGDLRQYIWQWSSGSYLKSLLSFLQMQSATAPCNVIVPKRIGLPTDGLALFHNKFQGRRGWKTTILSGFTSAEIGRAYRNGSMNLLLVDRLIPKADWSAFAGDPNWTMTPVWSTRNPGPKGDIFQLFWIERSK